MAEGPSRNAATLIGTIAILQWGAQTLISTRTVGFPAFQTMAMTFFLAFCTMAAAWIVRGENGFRHARHGPRVWLVGVTGLFGYYAASNFALRLAPAVDVTLLINLWPLLLMLFSGLLPGERVGRHHLLGALAGLAGTLVLFGGAAGGLLAGEALPGQAFALLAAVIWAGFGIASRSIGDVPTGSVGWICLAVSGAALLCHLALEDTVTSAPPIAWAAILALGVGPIGTAFFAWDVGVKRGDIHLLSVLGFMTPILSAACLIAAGAAVLDWRIAGATLLIVGGALIAARNEIKALLCKGNGESLKSRETSKPMDKTQAALSCPN